MSGHRVRLIRFWVPVLGPRVTQERSGPLAASRFKILLHDGN